jgi:site-specific recombinase XerD
MGGRRDQALFTLLYNTGARVSEATNLKVGDVVLDVSPVTHLHGKGRKRRSVPLPPRHSDYGFTTCQIRVRRRICSRAIRVDGCRDRA